MEPTLPGPFQLVFNPVHTNLSVSLHISAKTMVAAASMTRASSPAVMAQASTRPARVAAFSGFKPAMKTPLFKSERSLSQLVSSTVSAVQVCRAVLEECVCVDDLEIAPRPPSCMQLILFI